MDLIADSTQYTKRSMIENILIGTMKAEAQREIQKINTARKISSDPTSM